MSQVQIANGQGERRESLRGIIVKSSGGVPPVWAELVAHLPRRGRVLDYGSWQGLAALWLKAARPDMDVEFAHYSSSLLAQARSNALASGLELNCRAVFPLEGRWETIVLAAPHQNEALEMLSRQAAACLSPQGQMVLVDGQQRRDVLERCFGSIVPVQEGEGWSIIRCREPLKGEGQLPWRIFPTAVRGLDLELVSLPGNFSPQGLDLGTRVMLEEAVIPPGGRVLDLACGYGVVGIVASRLGAGEVAFVDDDLIALTAARCNLERLALKGELVHSHQPAAVPGKFDCILTNPPYHTEYSVARSFLEFAARRLKAGGWLYVVVKKPDWYVNKVRTLLGGCRVVERDGYAVISAQLRSGPAHGVKPAKTTRKHARRQEAARGRGKKNG